MNVRTESRPDPGEHLASPVLFAMQGVGKQWPKGPVVLDDVNLDLPAGTVTWIGGTNGAGKTTLLRVAAGLIRPDTGSIRLDGLDPERQRDEFQRRLGFISAVSVGLYARLTVRDHLDFWARLFYLPRAARKEAEARVAEAFGLTDLLDRRVDRLSMGQRQRVRLALAFMHSPRLVLLDEPATSLDSVALDLLRGAIDDAAAGGGICLAVGPEGVPTGVPASRTLLLRDGRLVAP
jgi:ABC-type multidrug transport system ATPase subunit